MNQLTLKNIQGFESGVWEICCKFQEANQLQSVNYTKHINRNRKYAQNTQHICKTHQHQKSQTINKQHKNLKTSQNTNHHTT